MAWQRKADQVKHIDSHEIPTVETTHFLGVQIDNKLEWNAHTRTLVHKLEANQHLLRRMKNILPRNCLKTIYYSHFQIHLQYGLLVWGRSASKDITELFKIQKQCLKLISPKATSTNDRCFADLHTPKLMDMI